jgi:hypothetical protein
MTSWKFDKDNAGRWPVKTCMSPSHNFPNMLYIPPGESHTHKCPACGMETTVRSPDVVF